MSSASATMPNAPATAIPRNTSRANRATARRARTAGVGPMSSPTTGCHGSGVRRTVLTAPYSHPLAADVSLLRGRLRRSSFLRSPMTEPLPSPAPVEPARRARWTMRRRLGAAVATLAVVALVVSLVVRLPYYVLSPGMSRPTEDLITVRGADTFDNDGAVDFLTVSMRQVTPIEVVAAWINGAQQIRSADEILGRLTPGESRDLDLRMMANSKDAAQYQALRRLGYDIRRLGTGAVIASVVDGGPVAGVLVAGDVVTAIDGRSIELSDELITAVGASAPGTVLTLDVEPFDATREGARPARRVEVVVGARPDDPTKGYLGITTFTRDLSFDFPVQV
ncbi:MAG: PDZ domain-containing protein, partial [Acidimicrobiia bacterium]|nr:PDZ domain-containing protein [Acidimicrobiia bacterium]